MHIETERLSIKPLNKQELELYAAENDLFEKAHGLLPAGRQLNEDLKALIRQYYLPALRYIQTDKYLFYTVWIVTDRSLNQVVAEFGFKGAAIHRKIEIGYDTFPPFRQQGYLTETLHSVIGWLNSIGTADQLLAETLHSNKASIRVLEKCGFYFLRQEKNMLVWQIPLNRKIF